MSSQNAPRSVEIYRLVSNPITGGTDPGVTTGRMMVSENTSPLPRDRVFFNSSYFDGTRLAPGGINVSRFTPGFEKTFFNGDASIEVRTPFASTLSSTIDTSSGAATSNDVQWGNVTMYAKALAYRSQTFALSTGMGITLPTANNVVFVNNG